MLVPVNILITFNYRLLRAISMSPTWWNTVYFILILRACAP